MRKQISDEIINKFNTFMEETGSVIRLKRETGIIDYTFKISLPEDRLIDNFIVNPTQEFYDMLINYFKSYNIELSFNNTWSTFWVK